MTLDCCLYKAQDGSEPVGHEPLRRHPQASISTDHGSAPRSGFASGIGGSTGEEEHLCEPPSCNKDPHHQHYGKHPNSHEEVLSTTVLTPPLHHIVQPLLNGVGLSERFFSHGEPSREL